MLGGRTSPPVGWVYIKQDIRTNPSSTNTANLPVSRFAYFIEDLGGLIDAERMGGTNSRPTGTNAEEISLTNLTGVTAPTLSTYTNNRPKYLTPGMLLTTNGGFLINTNDLRYFASRLRYCDWSNQNSNWSRIPFFPISSNAPYYPANAGYRKYPLTDLTLGGQSEIAATIISNFPNFSTRAGGMNTNLYVNALAANIVDYADANSSPTIQNIAGFNAVGYDSYPMLTHVFDKFTCTTNGSNPPTITINTYLQFWNPASTNSPATNFTVAYAFNDQIFSVAFTAATIISNSTLIAGRWSNNVAIPSLTNNSVYITSITTNITIPNSYTNGGNPWSTFASVTINTNQPTAPLSLTNSIALITSGITNMNLRSGYYRPGFSLTNSQITWAGVVLGVKGQGTEPGIANQAKALADPRMNNYVTFTNGVSSFTNTYWYSYPSETNTINPSLWPDGTSSNISSSGVRATNITFTPTQGIATLSDTPPCKISNRGFYTNICELGNIFDPIQWKPPAPVYIATNYSDTNITSTWTSNSIYGGGSTLRIGRPEHSRFAFTNLGGTYPVPSLGTSAAGLLEIFCTTNAYNWAGKININTAPLPVLAALAGGITLSNALYSGTAPVPADMIRAFTNGVVKFRQTYPFITPSQLAFISTDYGTTSPHWTNTWPSNAVFSTNPSGGLQGPTAINDQGREEWFSKIYNLTCVQSFNYRIYVVAQLTDTNGNPKGPMMRKYYQMYLSHNSPQPNTNAPTERDRDAPSVSPLPTYEAFY